VSKLAFVTVLTDVAGGFVAGLVAGFSGALGVVSELAFVGVLAEFAGVANRAKLLVFVFVARSRSDAISKLLMSYDSLPLPDLISLKKAKNSADDLPSSVGLKLTPPSYLAVVVSYFVVSYWLVVYLLASIL
jgi:hypothetical protein